MNRKKFSLTAAIIFAATTASLTAQVTIGEDKSPENFSVLELISNNTRGLRLPQLTTSERDNVQASLAFKAEITGKAMGLQIFNTDTKCVETWNGAEWISACAMCGGVPCVPPAVPVFALNLEICQGSKVSDLPAASIDGNTYKWYAAATGGSPLAANTALVTGTTYYVSQTNSYGYESSRASVNVSIVTGGACTAVGDVGITTFVNVMYDFQHQTLEAYSTSGGTATTYLWEYNDGTGFKIVPNNPVNSNKYVVYAADVANFAGAHSKEISFRCSLSNPNTSSPKVTDNLNILFINTNNLTGGYGTDENGVKYLKLNIGDGINTVAGGSTATLQVALTNLGSDEDADDLGDFYQWGRVADGHEHTVWKKGINGINRVDSITPFGSGGTSAVIDYKDGGTTPSYNPTTHQVDAGKYFGKFICSTGSGADNGDYDWYYNGGHDNFLWGQSTQSANPPYRTPARNGNDPCPNGWKVPSRWQMIDIYSGDASSSSTSPAATTWVGGVNNNWVWRGASGTGSTTVGGALITNANDEILFLPASGYRIYRSGALGSIGSYGYYWSSTYSSMFYAYNLYFYSGIVYAGNFYNLSKAYGFSVRCVAE
jgi:uncharacterized protein (TIGR02145 family)